MEIQELYSRICANIGKVIKGKEDVIGKAALCVLCGGHILMEDVPGTGKTTLVKALAKTLGLSFARVQFTPDLLPSDLTGIHFFDQKTQDFVFKPGPVFTNLLLADEINRATPRTQSSLLECMEEKQVTIDGETMKLDAPFLVAATQNPIEIQGTFPLPEAQLDRFFMRLSVGYPDGQAEKEMLSSFVQSSPLDTLEACVAKEELLAAQEEIRAVFLSEEIKDYLLAITNATRENGRVRLGVSPRGTLAFMRAAQAKAAVSGRNYVVPEDVKEVAADVLAHRILCKAANHSQNAAAREVLEEILNAVPAPEMK